MRFSGRLQVDGSGANWLRADVWIDRHRLALVSGSDELGSWSLSSVGATRLDGDRFELALGEEKALFAADDALAFSYDALPLLTKSGGLGGVVSKMRLALGRDREPMPGEPDGDVEPVVQRQLLPAEPPAERPSLRALLEAARHPSQAGPEASPIPAEPEPVVSVPSLSLDPSAAPVPETLFEEPAAPEYGLNRLFLRLEQAIDDVQSGAITPDQGRAIAEMAKAACLAVYAGDDERIDELAQRLLAPPA
jgi:hypothetical protein